MKVAFASTDGVHVNQHFGWCEMFYIYEVFEDDFNPIHEIDSTLKFENEIEKLEYKINCLEDSDIVYVLQIGPKAATLVQSAGIYPLKSTHENERIEDVIKSLQKLINGNTPLWLKRILLKNS